MMTEGSEEEEEQRRFLHKTCFSCRPPSPPSWAAISSSASSVGANDDEFLLCLRLAVTHDFRLASADDDEAGKLKKRPPAVWGGKENQRERKLKSQARLREKEVGLSYISPRPRVHLGGVPSQGKLSLCSRSSFVCFSPPHAE